VAEEQGVVPRDLPNHDGQKFKRDYALRDQIRRAAVSVMPNIAEGFERYSRTEFRHFLAIARGSASEMRSQLHLAHGLAYISDAEFKALYRSCVDLSRMLAALRAKSKAVGE
jgi:four helix bundle protein